MPLALPPALLALALAHAPVDDDAVAAAAPLAIAVRCQRVLDGLVARGVPGASAALVLPDGVVVTVVAGVASLDDPRPLTPSDRFLSGSVGKTYVTAVAHRLVQDGKLDLDARAASFFEDDEPPPEWLDALPNGRDVTLRQLLRHSSGIPRYVFKEGFFAALVEEPDRVWQPQELLAWVADDVPLFAPDAGWAYADTNYIVVGMVLERVTGRAFYELVDEHFLRPLELLDTVPSDRRRIPGMVQGHVVSARNMGIPELTLDESGAFTFNVQFEWCGGGYANTPADLARWAGLLYGGRALHGPYLDTLLDTVPAEPLGEGVRYGLGAMVRDTPLGPLVGHDGFMPGYLTSMGWFPDAHLAVALQLNTDDARLLGKPPTALLVELASQVDEG